MRSHRGVDSTNAGVDERLDGRVGVLRCAGVVREVQHLGDARVEGRERGELRTDVHVGRGVGRCDLDQSGREISDQVVDIRDGASHLRLPGVSVGVHHAGCDDATGRVDDDVGRCAMVGQVLGDLGDLRADHQHVAGAEVSDLRVHRDDGGPVHEHPPARVSCSLLQQIELR